jgi:hypothetical protein
MEPTPERNPEHATSGLEGDPFYLETNSYADDDDDAPDDTYNAEEEWAACLYSDDVEDADQYNFPAYGGLVQLKPGQVESCGWCGLDIEGEVHWLEDFYVCSHCYVQNPIGLAPDEVWMRGSMPVDMIGT